MLNSTPASKTYVFDGRPRFPLRVVVKRYWIGECPDAINHEDWEDALTLVFMHGNGCHKEQWEPTIQRLFQNQQAAARRSTTVRFHDMWSIDMPNQGDSAILNEELFLWGYDTCEQYFLQHDGPKTHLLVVSWEICARGVHTLLAGLGSGVDVDFSKRKLVLAGHSLASNVA